MEVANRYFDSLRCTSIRSSMGLPKKNSAVKPDWDHLDVQNQGVESEFARMIGERHVNEITPQVIEFDKAVTTLPVASGCNLYASPNPKNNIFTLSICFHMPGLYDVINKTPCGAVGLVGTHTQRDVDFM